MRLVLVVCTWALALAAYAQPSKPQRVGILQNGTVAVSGHMTEAFIKGLAEHGYVGGRNVVIEVRYAEGKLDRLPALAKELDALGLDLFFTPSALATHAARNAGMRAPMVFALAPDPVAEGFAQTLSRPGGNLTGLTSLSPEMTAKRIEVLREALPKVSRIAVLHAAASPGVRVQLVEAERVVRLMGKEMLPIDVKRLEDIEPAFAEMARWRADAVLVIETPLFFTNRGVIVGHAQKHRLPTVYTSKEHVEAGGLMSYGSNYADLARRAAGHAARILRGAKPGDLPIEQPVQFELVVNVKAAKALGVTLPRSLLVRADQVIE